MDTNSIANIVALFDRSALTEFEYSEGAVRLRLTRSTSNIVLEPRRTEKNPLSPSTIPPAAAAEPAPSQPETHSIIAGLSGTFYRRPAPEQPPYAEAGDRIEAGQAIGMIEAMKMLNAIETDHAGRIARFMVEDRSPVEAGAIIAVLTPLGDSDV